MRTAGAVLNVLIAASFAGLAAYWFRRGETTWAVLGGIAAGVNVALALVKLRAKRGEERP